MQGVVEEHFYFFISFSFVIPFPQNIKFGPILMNMWNVLEVFFMSLSTTDDFDIA